MTLKTLDIQNKRRKAKRLSAEDTREQKRLFIMHELMSLLSGYLKEYDSVCIEVEPSVADLFVDCLDKSVLSNYVYSQLVTHDSTQFVFRNKLIQL